MKRTELNSESISANDLGRLFACQNLMDDFLKYAINPKLSSFNKEEKLKILKLHQDINDLIVQLRINYIELPKDA